MLGTVFVSFALLGLHLTAFQFGITLAAAGPAGLAGSTLSTRLGMLWGAGRTVILCDALMVLGWAVIAFVPTSNKQAWIVIAGFIVVTVFLAA